MNNFLRDLKLGVRTAFRSPAYSIVAIITMALAIGANTLLFSIASPLVIRPLPLGDPASVAWIQQTNGPRGVTDGGTSMADFLDWRASAHSFTALAAREMGEGTLTGNGDPRRVTLARVTTDLQDVWGLSAVAGRLFEPGEDTPGRAPSGVISHRFWQEYFNGDPAVLNRTFTLDGQTLTVVGIMSTKIEFGGLARIDIWVPLPLDASRPRDDRSLSVMGTMAPGATLASTSAEMSELAHRLAAEYPATNADWEVSVLSSRKAVTSADTWVILGLMGVVVLFVLLIACASLANLARARLVGRKQDLTVRQALGASRVQLVRPLVAESLVLGVLGGVMGLVCAAGGVKLINVIAYEEYFKTLSIDEYVLGFNALLALATPLMFSLWPALSTSRDVDSETMRGGRVKGSRFGRRRGGVLIVSQVAMALSLLVVSALAVQSMINLRNSPTGLDVDHLLSFKFDLPTDRYPTDDERREFVHRLTTDLARIPGARGAALASHLPVFDPEVTRTFSGTDRDGTRDGEQPWASWFAVTPSFFDASGVSLIAGRFLDDGDELGRQPVGVLSRLAATRYFGDPATAIGRTLQMSGGTDTAHPITIVGVVDDTRNSNLTEVSPQVYVPLDQSPSSTLTALVASDAPEARIPDTRRVLRALDDGLATTLPKSLAQIVDEQTSSGKIVNGIFVGFAGLALLLAAAGLYGVISFTVGQRTQEFGVRLALGAEPSEIRALVVREGLKVSLIGMVVGLGAAWALAGASASVLYGVTPNDPLTYGAVTTTVMLVAACAVWIPATRAMRADPLTALRAD